MSVPPPSSTTRPPATPQSNAPSLIMPNAKNLVENHDKFIEDVAKFCAEFIKGLVIPGKQFQDLFNKITYVLNLITPEETKEKIKKSVDIIIDLSKEGLKLIANGDSKGGLGQFKLAGKEVLSCICNVFTEIKKGLENGFDKVKHGLGAAYKKLESLAKSMGPNQKSRV